MKAKIILSVLIIFCTSLKAQQGVNDFSNNSIKVSSDKDRYENFAKENFNLLKGFDEKTVIQQLRAIGIQEINIKEALFREQLKFISKSNSKSINSISNSSNKTLNTCDDLGFELQSFANWTGRLATLANASWASCPTPLDSLSYIIGLATGPNNLNIDSVINERQIILTCSNCYDSIARHPLTGNYLIPYLAPGGGTTSVRLGNKKLGGETEKLIYKLKVDSVNYQLLYRYAIVYENPIAHGLLEQPFFVVCIKDSLGNQIATNNAGFCYYADPTDTSFILLPGGSTYSTSSGDILIKPWTNVSVDLSPYIGKTLSLEFATGDCALGGHFGYAYIDGDCGNWRSNFLYNSGDTSLKLVAPPYFLAYQWVDSLHNPIPGATNDTFEVKNPTNNSVYCVRIQSSPGAASQTYFNITVNSTFSIPIVKSQLIDFEVFPNPLTDVLNLKYSLTNHSNSTITIENVMGEILKSETMLKQNPGSYNQTFSLQELNSGVYFVSLTVNGIKNAKKFLLLK